MADAKDRITKAVRKTARGKADRSGSSILVHSDRRNLHLLVRADASGPDAFHIASVGKLFTIVLIGKLIDAGILDFDTPVRGLLSREILDGLFIIDGTDYQNEVTLRMLLGHTSGAADYYGDKGKDGRTVA